MNLHAEMIRFGFDPHTADGSEIMRFEQAYIDAQYRYDMETPEDREPGEEPATDVDPPEVDFDDIPW